MFVPRARYPRLSRVILVILGYSIIGTLPLFGRYTGEACDLGYFTTACFGWGGTTLTTFAGGGLVLVAGFEFRRTYRRLWCFLRSETGVWSFGIWSAIITLFAAAVSLSVSWTSYAVASCSLSTGSYGCFGWTALATLAIMAAIVLLALVIIGLLVKSAERQADEYEDRLLLGHEDL